MNDFQRTRIDGSHQRFHEVEGSASNIVRLRQRPPVAVATAVEPLGRCDESPLADAACFVVAPGGSIPDIVVHHADDIALHLAQRLKEVEAREVAQSEFARQLSEAEATARTWVVQRDSELTSLERSIALREAEVATQAAALAAAEIAGDSELCNQRAALEERESALNRRGMELAQREQRLRDEQAALNAAFETLRADRQQAFQELQADQSQIQRALAQFDLHREALDQRERAMESRESELSRAQERRVDESGQRLPLDLSLERAKAARDHRAAAEHRWIAGQLWSRLASSKLATESELADSLVGLRRQLQRLYRNEREALEQLQMAVGSVAREIKSTSADQVDISNRRPTLAEPNNRRRKRATSLPQ